MNNMKHYIVFYRLNAIMSDLEAPFGYSCSAKDTDDAEQQCLNNIPDADIVWVVDTDNYQGALDDYYRTSIEN